MTKCPDCGQNIFDEEVNRLTEELEKQRDIHLKWMRERPVAPHPKDQLNNLSNALWLDAEAECKRLAEELEKARGALSDADEVRRRWWREPNPWDECS